MQRLRPSRLAAIMLTVVLVGIATWVALGRISPNEPASESVGNPGRVEPGATLYVTNCASCHGVKGEGQPNWQSPSPDGTYPAPPHDVTGHTWHHADRLLFGIIRDGGASYESATFKSRMPAFGGLLRDEEMGAVLAHIKTLWGTKERQFQAEVSARDPLPDTTR